MSGAEGGRDGAHLRTAQEQFERWWACSAPSARTPVPVYRWSQADLDPESSEGRERGQRLRSTESSTAESAGSALIGGVTNL
jgi:hypothetical protein